ncbi:RNA-guided endonuclease TnpB family protein [Halosegnis sp.]|uniref:RNA-guided endonuclease TnpB family protein n=1 Tax=Halosegnis sp. TaxID=2864959 RepID=UPI0035D529F5
MQNSLTSTLVFQLDIREGSQQLLYSGQLEARRVVNEIFRLDSEDYDWDTIEDLVVERSNHVKNTTQRLFDKATDALERYYDEDDYGHPRQNYEDGFPIRMNHGEGYQLSLDDDSEGVNFRVTALKRQFVRGTLQGSQHHLDRLRTALEGDDWRVGTAEVVRKRGQYELHVNVTHEKADVAEKTNATTFVGVDVNEDCVGLAAVTEDGVEATLVIEYPEIKRERHEYFTIRKRMQSVGQTSLESEIERREQRFVHDQLHQVSRRVVEWAGQFENPVIVFENLEDLRDGLDYGTRMNRRLHSLPFAQLQEFVSYKAAWRGIPSDHIDPEYTSQACPVCGHTARANRQGKRFKCVECRFQDHADRKAALLIGAKGLKKQNRNVPALNNLPVIRTRKVRRRGNGEREPPDHNPYLTIRGDQANGQHGSVSG